MKRPKSMRELLGQVPVVPVVTLAEAAAACELARSLHRGGIPVIEVTLRTPDAFAAIEAIVREVPEVAVGAGTVLSRADMRRAECAGAVFTVSPGSTPELLAAGRESMVPYLPGAATASELQDGVAAGYDCFKFFPAASLGGPAALSTLAGPFPQLAFCATGGITAANAQSWLELPNVLAVGGSWIAPADAVAQRDWTGIEGRARDAATRFRPKVPR